MSDVDIVEWLPTGPDSSRIPTDLDDLAELLHKTVHLGASVSFILPFEHADARRFWSDAVLPGVRPGVVRAFVARSSGRIVGSVLLKLDTPPNQPHRAEIAKMLVHPDHRRKGIARSLMVVAEKTAREERRTLLTLDTHTGGYAEDLYRSLGYQEVGVIPGFSCDIDSETLQDATFFYKTID